MKITVSITETVAEQTSYSYQTAETEERTIADIPGVEMTKALAGKFLRALADEVDPPKAMANPQPYTFNSGTLR